MDLSAERVKREQRLRAKREAIKASGEDTDNQESNQNTDISTSENNSEQK